MKRDWHRASARLLLFPQLPEMCPMAVCSYRETQALLTFIPFLGVPSVGRVLWVMGPQG